MSTRVVSFRMTEREYNNMMIECHRICIGSAEWVQQKIAFANYMKIRHYELIEQLKVVRRKIKYGNYDKAGLDELEEIINSL